jgi:hypothetical protein
LQLQLIAKINRLLKLKFRVIVQTNFRVIVQTIQPHGADAVCTITLKCKTKKWGIAIAIPPDTRQSIIFAMLA